MNQEQHYNPFNPLDMEENEIDYERYFDKESSYMPEMGYAKSRDAMLFRDRAALVISKYGKCDYFPFIAYLAMNYFDRYMSRRNRVQDYPSYTQHDVDVVASACLILAWKTKGVNLTIPQFLAERPELEDISTEQLETMENNIPIDLDWRMRPIMPFCFVPYFRDKFDSKYGFRPRTICEIIVHAQDDIWMTEFRPSVIAVSAFLAASDYLYPGGIVRFLSQILFERNFMEVQRDIDTCMESMVRLCHDLDLLIEAAVPEDPSAPTFKVQARQKYGRSSQGGETSSSSLPESGYAVKRAERTSDPKGKAKEWEIVKTEDEGDNKWAEMYRVTEQPRMAEDSEEVQFSFKLRWRVKDATLNPILEYLAELDARGEPEPAQVLIYETETETDSDQIGSSNDRSLQKRCSCRCGCTVL